MLGPFSGLLFIVGAIMFFVGRDRNNDELFSRGSLYNRCGSPEINRIMFMIFGIACIIAAVVMWIYMLVNGDPDPPPDLNSIINGNSSK